MNIFITIYLCRLFFVQMDGKKQKHQFSPNCFDRDAVLFHFAEKLTNSQQNILLERSYQQRSDVLKEFSKKCERMKSAFEPDCDSRIRPAVAKNSHSRILSVSKRNAFYHSDSLKNIVRVADVEEAAWDREDSGYGSDRESRNEFVGNGGDSYDESGIVIAKNNHSQMLLKYNNAFRRSESVKNIVRLNAEEDVEVATGDRDSGYDSDGESRNEFFGLGDSYENLSNSREVISSIVSHTMSVAIVSFRNLGGYKFKIKRGVQARVKTIFNSRYNGDNDNNYFRNEVGILLSSVEEQAVIIGKTKRNKVDSGEDIEQSRVDVPSCRASNVADVTCSEDAADENYSRPTNTNDCTETRNSDSPTHSDIDIASEAVPETDMRSCSRTCEEPVCIGPRPTTIELRCPQHADTVTNISGITAKV